MHSLERIRQLSQNNVLKTKKADMSRSVSGIEESDETEHISVPLHIDLPPLAVGHFAKVEEDQTNAGEMGEENHDSIEERVLQIEKIMR